MNDIPPKVSDNSKDNHSNITNKYWVYLLKLQKFILIASSILIIAGVSLVVLFRYILKVNLFGMEEIIIIGAFWLYFIGGAYGTYDKSHISADFLSSYVKNIKIKSSIQLFTSLLTLAICLLYTFWSVEFFQWTYSSGAKTTALHIPVIFSQSAITVGFFLMSFYLLVYLIQDTKKLLSLLKS